MTEKDKSLGKIDIKAMRKLVDKKSGRKVTFDLRDESPSEVRKWISTGSTWLDCVICRGQRGGIPCGRISELAGLSSCVTEDTIIETESTKIQIGKIKGLLDTGRKVKVKSRNGEFVEITQFLDKGYLPTLKTTLENGLSIKTTSEHRFFSDSGWIHASSLEIGKTALLCEDGSYSVVKSVEEAGEERIVDISVAGKDKSYFGNGILNHNTGKSYMAMQIIANAQKMGIVPVYADPEDSLDPSFMEKSGVDLDNVIYMQPSDLESFLDSIEELMKQHPGTEFLFVLDSLAATPTASDNKGDYNPNSSVGVKARVLSLAFQKLRQMLTDTGSTFLIINQLKTNISGMAEAPGGPKYATITQKYITPGGKAPEYWTSLRIWLTNSTSKKQNVFDDKGYRVGSYVKARIVKSRFGTQDRFAEFKILWGDEVGVMDDESLFEAISSSEYLESGKFYKILDKDKNEMFKWQKREEGFAKLYREEPKFRERVQEILEEEIIMKFDKRLAGGDVFLDDGKGEDIQA